MINAILLLAGFSFIGFYIGYRFSKYQLSKTMCDMFDNIPIDSDEQFINGVIYVSKSLQKIM